MIVKRNDGEKVSLKMDEVASMVPEILDKMHDEMLKKARSFFDDKVVDVSSIVEFEKVIKDKGIVRMNWCGSSECEDVIKEKTGASTRCMPLGEQDGIGGKCLFCGKENKCLIYFSRSY